MAEPSKKDGLLPDIKVEPPKALPKQNPVFRMMGLPNLPKRLPSRNWMIFWTVIGSFAGAITYDRMQKKAVQKKWCDLVAHLSQDSLPVNRLPRKLTIYLSAAPGDSIGPSRQYFKDYVKPILVAAAMDYDVIEGRKEGDVRYGTAEQIRRLRRRKGETGTGPEPEKDTAMAIDLMRERLLLLPEPGVKGDLVLGRHTWKEYIRGLHEGWLGPLDEPILPPEPKLESELSPIHPPTKTRTDDPASSIPVESADTAEASKPEEPKEPEKKEEEKKKPYPPPAYLAISAYSNSPASPHIPQVLEPSQPIHQQHLLGFLKTPQRTYNFLNRRSLADEIGRQTAAIVLAQYRPYETEESFASSMSSNDLDATPIATKAPESDAEVVQTAQIHEQQGLLSVEELTWHKSVRKPRKEEDKSEQVWLNDIVLDPRLADRMRKFELDPAEEDRAKRIAAGVEKSKAIPIRDLRQDKPVIGNVDDE